MVPRSFERSATIPFLGSDGERGWALEGLLIPGPDAACEGAVIAPPHPLYGGSMDTPVATEIALACEKSGLTSLRFNWRGVGASAGEVSGEESEADEDYAAAFAHLAASVSGAVVACGYSFGAAAALRAAAGQPRIRRLLLVAPPPPLIDGAQLAAFPGRILVVVGERDGIASAAQLAQMLEPCPHARLEVVPGTDHFFMTGLAELGRAAASFLGRISH